LPCSAPDIAPAGAEGTLSNTHTYSYKILHKTGCPDIIGLRPAPTLRRVQIGHPG
jgi:hypothetical protein